MKQYKPHKYQNLFHKSRAKVRACFAGRRGGKTHVGQIEDTYWVSKRASKCCHRLVEEVNGKFVCSGCGREIKDVKQTESVLGCVVLPKYDFIDDLYLPFFNDWLPPGSWKFNRQSATLEILKTGGKLFFESADDPTSVGHGKKYHFIHIEEARDIRKLALAWDTLKPCLADYDGYAWVTTTTNGKDDAYKIFYKPAGTVYAPKDAMSESPQDPKKRITSGDKDHELFTWRTIDNPYINHDRVMKDKLSMNPLMWRQEYFATVEDYEGLVYPDFKHDKHVKDIEHSQSDLYFVSLDVGWNHPTACVLAKEDGQHNIHIVDEFREQHLQPAEVVERLLQMLSRNGVNWMHVKEFIIDPASRGTQQTSGQSMLAQINEEVYKRGMDFAFVPGNNDVMAGIARMTKLLREGHITFDTKCIMSIEEMDEYHWPQFKEGSDGNRDKRPYKLGDDLVDAIRYLIMQRPDWWEHPIPDPGMIPGTYDDRNDTEFEMKSDILDYYYNESGVIDL